MLEMDVEPCSTCPGKLVDFAALVAAQHSSTELLTVR